MTDYKKITVAHNHDKQTATIVLNAPKGNVLDAGMMTELTAVIAEEGRRSSTKALIFKGAGEHFSFGASVEEHQKEQAPAMLQTFHGMMRALVEASKPTFALVRGQCLGGGMELACFCNWIFAAEDARFGQPEIQLGVYPPVAALILPHIVGQVAADDLILSGRSVSAREAQTKGLVFSVSEDPEEELEKYLAKQILPKSAVALQYCVKASRYEMYKSFLQNIDFVEKMYVAELMETHDANEGITSFIEKRKPVWKNA